MMIDTGFKRDAAGYYIDKLADDADDYGYNWARWMDPAETISTSIWAADAGITLADPTVDGWVTGVVVGGGLAGMTYTVSNTVTSSSGRSRTLSFRVKVT